VPANIACAVGGEGSTSCFLPFPGRPGLSQSSCGGFFRSPWFRLFFQGTRENMVRMVEKWKIKNYTTYSPRIHLWITGE